ncbi:UNVERIFIED_CONTAM: hypothetical protein PYX00_007295 [Menopon gallinae]|uniref:Uncharacterized protein n=1 Tax=Menopon gallinae TaxID=328185 RepID=A0AAW2HJC8_9NEOP
MVFDLFSCTFDTLNNLKFNELQKLAVQFQVNKRWAKKREIIEKLLLLRDQEIEKRNPPVNKSPENTQWIDGTKALSLAESDTNHEPNENDRRLTYCVNNSAPETTDRRLTFTIAKGNESKIACNSLIEVPENIDRRLTYNADDLKFRLNNVSKTPGLKQIDENVEQCASKDENAAVQESLTLNQAGNMNIVEKKNNQTGSNNNNQQSKIKMLTIPYAGRLGQNRKTAMKDTKIKLPEKIALTGKSKPTEFNKINKLTTPLNSKLDNKTKSLLLEKKNTLQKSITKVDSPKLDIKRMSTLDNHRSLVPRRKSKTEDNVLVKNLKATANMKFFSPRESGVRIPRRHSESPQSLESKIPKPKSGLPTLKPITATKMPDFSKIHQRQFEQMDSLHDYVRKKEERAKKLFGISQPNIPVKINKDVFQFKSCNNEKENQLNKSVKKSIPTLVKADREKPNRKDIISRPGIKSNIVMNLKEQNRKHINGIM